jgi:hypothetical protein
MLRFQDLIDALNTIITSYTISNKPKDTRTTLLDYLTFGIQRLAEAQTKNPEKDAEALQAIQKDITLLLQRVISLFDRRVIMKGLEVSYNRNTVSLAGLKTPHSSDAAELIKAHLLAPLDLSEQSTPEPIGSRINTLFVHEQNLDLIAKKRALAERITPPFSNTMQSPFTHFLQHIVYFTIRQIEAPSEHEDTSLDSDLEQSLNIWILLTDSDSIDTLLNGPRENIPAEINAKITDAMPNATLLRHICAAIPLILAPDVFQGDNAHALTQWLTELIAQAQDSPLEEPIRKNLLKHFGLSYSSNIQALDTSVQNLFLGEQSLRLTRQHQLQQQEARDEQLKEHIQQHATSQHAPIPQHIDRDVLIPQAPHPTAGNLVLLGIWGSLADRANRFKERFSDKKPAASGFSDNESEGSERSQTSTGYTSS